MGSILRPFTSAYGHAVAAYKTAVPGLNCAHQNLPYIQVLTVQRERREVVVSCRSTSNRWLPQRRQGRAVWQFGRAEAHVPKTGDKTARSRAEI
jgi:hypothetical protein